MVAEAPLSASTSAPAQPADAAIAAAEDSLAKCSVAEVETASTNWRSEARKIPCGVKYGKKKNKKKQSPPAEKTPIEGDKPPSSEVGENEAGDENCDPDAVKAEKPVTPNLKRKNRKKKTEKKATNCTGESETVQDELNSSEFPTLAGANEKSKRKKKGKRVPLSEEEEEVSSPRPAYTIINRAGCMGVIRAPYGPTKTKGFQLIRTDISLKMR